jgi:signal transduction histidine kinase
VEPGEACPDEGAGGGAGDCPSRLAELLDAHCREIVDAYQSNLAAIGSPITHDPDALAGSVLHAEQILADVGNVLRTGETGTKSVAGVIDSGDALLASSVLFQTVVSAVTGLLGSEPESFHQLGTVTAILQRCLALDGHAPVDERTGFVLDQVRAAQLSERRRIARELHDRVGYSLSVTHRQLELFSLYQSTDPSRAAQKVAAAQQATQDSMRSLRAVAAGLYAEKRVGSLRKALTSYLDSVGTDGVDLRVRVKGEESWAPPDVLEEVFLVLREAARNALRHAHPTTVIMNVDISPREIRAFVEDDGCGFDSRQVPADRLGIRSMRERARLLGGELTIRSQPDRGTHVDFSSPLGRELHAGLG